MSPLVSVGGTGATCEWGEGELVPLVSGEGGTGATCEW